MANDPLREHRPGGGGAAAEGMAEVARRLVDSPAELSTIEVTMLGMLHVLGRELAETQRRLNATGAPSPSAPEGATSDVVQRWDVYDIADELADVPGMLSRAIDDPHELPGVIAKVEGLVARLWTAAKRGGQVGPSPEYATVTHG